MRDPTFADNPDAYRRSLWSSPRPRGCRDRPHKESASRLHKGG